MSNNKRFYWLKLKEGFFDELNIKYLKNLPDGDRLVIVYLKMQLKSLKTEGIIKFSELLPTCEDELALALDESIDIVTNAINVLIKLKLIEKWDNQTLYMVAMQELIGSEGSSAQRMRRHRELMVTELNDS